MSSLIFLMWTGFKNTLKELKRKPGKLVLYIVVFALVIVAIIGTLMGAQSTSIKFPEYMFGGIFFAFLMMFFIISVQKGLLSGDTIFDMSDVNLLFVSPVNPRTILLYGLIRLAKMSFFAGIFILFQGSTLKNFGIDFGGLIIIFVICIIVMMIFSLMSLLIYSVTNSSPKRKNIVKFLAVLLFVPLVIYFGLEYLASGDIMAALDHLLNSLLFECIPLLGWSVASMLAFIQGNILAGLGWLFLTLLAGILMFVYIMVSHSDYYEDVLVATETAFEKKRAAMEGDVQAAAVMGGNIKVRGMGLNGRGASVFLYKHLRESFRQNKFGFFGIYTAIVAVIIIALSLILRDSMDLTIVLQVLMWIQIFMIGTGRGLMEIYNHYIYMIPESSLSKIIWANLELVIKTFVESILFIGIPGIIMQTNIFIVICSIIVYTLFSMLLIGFNYLSIRWTQAKLSQGILITIYFIGIALIMLPGVIPALIVGFTIGGVLGTILGLVILAIWELIAAIICFALSKSVLDRCDMPTVNAFGK